MRISIIAAIARNGVIGDQGGLPWHIPQDLRRFRQLTIGKPIIMGRKTYESIGRPLDGRLNIVMSSNPSYEATGCMVVDSVESALKAASQTGSSEVMVIGGAKIYELFLPVSDWLYLTLIDGEFEGDTWFPDYDRDEWQRVSEKTVLESGETGFQFRFVEYSRK